MRTPHSIPWRLSDIRDVKTNGLSVFSCFACGGGSTMGYKLAGFKVLGYCEIDPKMSEIYDVNHNPKLRFKLPIQEFKSMNGIPEELYDLDVLDGSPPCSSFSMSGSREKAWGTDKRFREGQAKQVLDDLFFHYIDVAKKLRPRVVIAENVKGLLLGNARGYVKKIFEAFESAGYNAQLFLLNSSKMGVPQYRERTFFVARRKDLKLKPVEFIFNEPLISVSDAWTGLKNQHGKPLSEKGGYLWRKTKHGDSFAKRNNGQWFNSIRLHKSRPSNTLPATCMISHPNEPRIISDMEAVRIQSFPDDFDFIENDARYVCGMSVPPLMMERVALEVAAQLFGKPYKPLVKPVIPYGDEPDAHP